MRIALIADIHGNTVALDAVFAGLQHHLPDVIVCLGDIAAGGPDPGGTHRQDPGEWLYRRLWEH